MNMDPLELSKKLIAINSDCQLSNSEISDFLQRLLEDSHFDVERLAYTDTNGELKVNLIAKKGVGAGGFGIFCHSDTIPTGNIL